MTQTQYARKRGISQQAVSLMVRDGRIPSIRGKIDPEIADAALEANTDQSKPRNAVSGDPKGTRNGGEGTRNGGVGPPIGSLAHHRARREALRVEREEIELARMRDELVPRDQVQREVFSLSRLLRDRILAVPARIAAEIAVESDPSKVRLELENRLREALGDAGEKET